MSEMVEEAAVELPFPPQLTPDLFLTSEFDPSTFLLPYQHLPLADLRSDLRSYLTTLRKRLVDVVDAEWEEFVKIGLGGPMSVLRGSEGQMGRGVLELREELEAALVKLESSKQALKGMEETCEKMIEERKVVRGRKTYLRLLLNVEEGLTRVERMLDDEGSVGEPEGRSGRLERVVGEWTRLKYLVGKAEEQGSAMVQEAGEVGDIPFVLQMQKQLQTLSTRLLDLLSTHFSFLLTQSSPPRSPLPAFTVANSYFPLTPDPTQTSFRTTRSSTPGTPRPSSSFSGGPNSLNGINPEDALQQCLRCFQSMGQTRMVEEVVRERKGGVRDWVISNISQSSLLRPPSPGVPATPFTPYNSSRPLQPPPPDLSLQMLSPPNRPSTLTTEDDLQITGLTHLYNSILSYISTDCARLLEVAERKLGGKGEKGTSDDEFYVLANVLWDEVGRRLMNELGTVVWAPGRPDKFHQNYTLTRNFVDRIESLCPTLRHLNVLRSHPTYVAFHKRWQLPVYFQLRFKEIVVRVEGGIDEGSAPPNERGFLLRGTLAVYGGVKACWDPTVYISDLSHRFWRLSLQLLSRYRTWLDETLPSHVQSTPLNSSSTPERSPGRPGTPNAGHGGHQGVAGAGIGQDEEKMENNTMRQISLVVADARKLEKAVLDFWNREIRERIPAGERVAAEAALDQTLANILEILPPLISTVVTILSKRCGETIKNVARMPTQVRSLRKRPSEPSTYMGSMLRPLKAFVDTEGKVCDVVTIQEISRKVLEDVVSRYAQALTAMRKTDDSLRRLKRGKQQTTSSFFFRQQQSKETEEEEEDKVGIQMGLDVRSLEGQIEALGIGVKAGETDGWVILRRVVEEREEQ